MPDDGQYLLSAKRTEVISSRLEFSVATGFAAVAREGSFGDDPHERYSQQEHYVEHGSGSPRNDKKCYFRSTISIQFGCVPIG